MQEAKRVELAGQALHDWLNSPGHYGTVADDLLHTGVKPGCPVELGFGRGKNLTVVCFTFPDGSAGVEVSV